MANQLVYTSSPRGLKPGAVGFCVVACTRGMREQTTSALEALSGYRRVYTDANAAARNPVAYSHVVIETGTANIRVLARVADAGLDYSGRTNKIASFLDVTQDPPAVSGPAALFAAPNLFVERWTSADLPRYYDAPIMLPQFVGLPAGCEAWRQTTGDPGWAGVLAATVATRRQVVLVVRPDQNVLRLFQEAIALLPTPAERWNATFSTYYMKTPPGVRCQWKAVMQGSPEELAFRNAPGALVLDLTAPGRLPNINAAATSDAARRLVSAAQGVAAGWSTPAVSAPGVSAIPGQNPANVANPFASIPAAADSPFGLPNAQAGAGVFPGASSGGIYPTENEPVVVPDQKKRKTLNYGRDAVLKTDVPRKRNTTLTLTKRLVIYACAFVFMFGVGIAVLFGTGVFTGVDEHAKQVKEMAEPEQPNEKVVNAHEGQKPAFDTRNQDFAATVAEEEEELANGEKSDVATSEEDEPEEVAENTNEDVDEGNMDAASPAAKSIHSKKNDEKKGKKEVQKDSVENKNADADAEKIAFNINDMIEEFLDAGNSVWFDVDLLKYDNGDQKWIGDSLSKYHFENDICYDKAKRIVDPESVGSRDLAWYVSIKRLEERGNEKNEKTDSEVVKSALHRLNGVRNAVRDLEPLRSVSYGLLSPGESYVPLETERLYAALERFLKSEKRTLNIRVIRPIEEGKVDTSLIEISGTEFKDRKTKFGDEKVKLSIDFEKRTANLRFEDDMMLEYLRTARVQVEAFNSAGEKIFNTKKYQLLKVADYNETMDVSPLFGEVVPDICNNEKKNASLFIEYDNVGKKVFTPFKIEGDGKKSSSSEEIPDLTNKTLARTNGLLLSYSNVANLLPHSKESPRKLFLIPIFELNELRKNKKIEVTKIHCFPRKSEKWDEEIVKSKKKELIELLGTDKDVYSRVRYRAYANQPDDETVIVGRIIVDLNKVSLK